MMLVLTLVVVGCTTTNGRFDHRAKAKRVGQHSKMVHGDKLGKQVNTRDRYVEAGRKIRIAIEEGKMTPEEGREKMAELRKKLGNVNRQRKGK